MAGCYLCKGHGCDDCLEKDAQMVTGKSNNTCIECGRDIIGKTYSGLCRLCIQEEKKIPLHTRRD
jgi:hypothetical protein